MFTVYNNAGREGSGAKVTSGVYTIKIFRTLCRKYITK